MLVYVHIGTVVAVYASKGPLVYVLKITKSHETFFKFGHLKFRNNQIILFPSNSTIKQHQAVSSISFNRSTRPDNGNKTCMRVGCNNTPKKGQDYCKNHKRKSKCQFKGCGNTTKSHLRYCGLHYLEGVERNKEVMSQEQPSLQIQQLSQIASVSAKVVKFL